MKTMIDTRELESLCDSWQEEIEMLKERKKDPSETREQNIRVDARIGALFCCIRELKSTAAL
jgi:hypothetical protein